MTTGNQITLGELIDLLKGCESFKKEEPVDVYFDFCGSAPLGDVYSYRGIYAHLCIEASLGYRPGQKLPEFVEKLSDAVGREFEGWKGGGFVMRRSTPVWVAFDAGECFGTAVTGVRDEGYMVVITTAHEEY